MSLLRSSLARVLVMTMWLLTACVPGRETVPTLSAPTTACPWVEVLPTITELQPAEAKPGSEVTVIASGGYFRDNCGAYNESSRVYKIYLDDEPAGSLTCYVNHCEGKLPIPQGAALGTHCLGVQKGTCQMEISVAGG